MNEKLDCKVLILGGGPSGIAAGVELQRRLGEDDFIIVERREGFGGTWRTFYPGIACDVPAFYYQYSFKTNGEWSERFAPGPEFLKYFEDVAREWRLPERALFNTAVVGTEYLANTDSWLVTLKDEIAGKVHTLQSKVILSCLGGLVKPQDWNIPGKNTFAGKIFHTAEWDREADFHGKRVIVVGNGASGSQVVPALAREDKAQSIIQISKSRHWYLPRNNPHHSESFKSVFRRFPFLVKVIRYVLFWVLDADWPMFKMNVMGAYIRKRRERAAAAYIKSTAPVRYHDILIPDFAIGCKRRVFDPYYLQSLHAPKVSVVEDRITEVTRDAVKTQKGETYPADIIVLANGYKPVDHFNEINIKGTNGETVASHWKRFGGPEAYNGTVLSCLPNFFIMFGPNCATGHHSVLFTLESQIHYCWQFLRPILRGEIERFAVKDSAERQYSHVIQTASKDTVFEQGGCISVSSSSSRLTS